jgi:hypothetical protein
MKLTGDKAMKTATKSRDDERREAHNHTGKCAFDAIKELVDGLKDWQKAAEDEGWSGPYKDEYGATYFRNEAEEPATTWACADWQHLCEAHNLAEPTEQSEDGLQAIHEDPLSVLIRDSWHEPGKPAEDGPEEYEILLSTGGPATRIRGELDQYCQPETARLEVQDWFVPWQEWRGEGWSEDVLLDYARCFYFGD